MSCAMELLCSNSTLLKGEQLSRCALCRLSYDNVGHEMPSYWLPIKSAKAAGVKHPDLVREKRENKRDKFLAKQVKNRERDLTKRRVSRQAAAAERKTEKQIIKSTLNSGRRNKDGDHVHLGSITLDTKLQTTRENPIINLAELEKVRSDAIRAGKMIGGLVIRNKHDVGCVVLKEEDYVKLTRNLPLQRITREIEATSRTAVEVGQEIPGPSKNDSELVKGS